MELLKYIGSTSQFSRASADRIIKSPMEIWRGNPNYRKREEENAKAIAIEAQILKKLGSHPRIVPSVQPQKPQNLELSIVYRFWGVRENGIELSEASHGDLQTYIDSNDVSIDVFLRRKWSLQAVEAVAFLHEQGVIHSDLRLQNYLVHGPVGPCTSSSLSLDLWLCDFGGSTCEELGLNGGKLPDDPFFDPRAPWVATLATDVFSLGSIIYTILTGHWPHREGASPVTREDEIAYEAEVIALFTDGKFPDLTNVIGREVIQGCWDHQYGTGKDVLEALKSEMRPLVVDMLE